MTHTDPGDAHRRYLEAAFRALQFRRELEAEITAARRLGVSQAQLEAIAARYPRARRFAAALRAST